MRRIFFVFREDHSHIKDAPFLSIWLSPRSLNDFGSLLRKNRVVRQGNKGGIGKKHAERVDTAHWLRSETQLNSCCFIFFLQLEGICMEALYKCDVLFYCFQNQQTARKKLRIRKHSHAITRRALTLKCVQNGFF